MYDPDEIEEHEKEAQKNTLRDKLRQVIEDNNGGKLDVLVEELIKAFNKHRAEKKKGW